jgi:hypothetical protein
VSTSQLEEMYYLIEDMKEDIKEELELRKKEDEEKAKKTPQSLFTKKFTFGQTVYGAWLASIPLSLFYIWLFWPLIRY